ncbi:hypothetical protein M3Y96_00837900 [Aphelenchoides besseyi]|nr:hypothetical protein M3Y96_00837900 [Aphelenchoides besseyi]
MRLAIHFHGTGKSSFRNQGFNGRNQGSNNQNTNFKKSNRELKKNRRRENRIANALKRSGEIVPAANSTRNQSKTNPTTRPSANSTTMMNEVETVSSKRPDDQEIMVAAQAKELRQQKLEIQQLKEQIKQITLITKPLTVEEVPTEVIGFNSHNSNIQS